MNYEDKTIEELIDLLEDKDETISDLQCDLQAKEDEYDEVSEENGELSVEMSRIEEFDIEKEPFAEKAFNAGYEAKENARPLMRAWLNYKIEARL